MSTHRPSLPLSPAFPRFPQPSPRSRPLQPSPAFPSFPVVPSPPPLPLLFPLPLPLPLPLIPFMGMMEVGPVEEPGVGVGQGPAPTGSGCPPAPARPPVVLGEARTLSLRGPTAAVASTNLFPGRPKRCPGRPIGPGKAHERSASAVKRTRALGPRASDAANAFLIRRTHFTHTYFFLVVG